MLNKFSIALTITIFFIGSVVSIFSEVQLSKILLSTHNHSLIPLFEVESNHPSSTGTSDFIANHDNTSCEESEEENEKEKNDQDDEFYQRHKKTNVSIPQTPTLSIKYHLTDVHNDPILIWRPPQNILI